MEWGKQQDHNPGLLESRICPVQRSAWKIPWDMALEKRGVQKSWWIFKGQLLQAQEWSIPTGRNEAEGLGGLHG